MSAKSKPISKRNTKIVKREEKEIDQDEAAYAANLILEAYEEQSEHSKLNGASKAAEEILQDYDATLHMNMSDEIPES